MQIGSKVKINRGDRSTGYGEIIELIPNHFGKQGAAVHEYGRGPHQIAIFNYALESIEEITETPITPPAHQLAEFREVLNGETRDEGYESIRLGRDW